MSEFARLVLLHDREHGDVERVRQSAGIPALLSVRSFTDTYPDPSLFNAGLREAASSAEYLVVQHKLLRRPLTAAARTALGAAIFSKVPTVFGTFNDDYYYKELHSQALDRLVETETLELQQ